MTICVVCCAPSAPELVAKARQLAANAAVSALVEGDAFDAANLGACGADTLYRLPACVDDCTQGTRIAQALRFIAPDAALFPATVRGRFLSAWVAARLQTGLTADCTALSVTPEGLLLQTRPAYGGNLLADILCRNHRPQLASVRPGVFALPQAAAGTQAHTACPPVIDLPVDQAPALLSRIAFAPAQGGMALQNAQVVVAGGKGIGGQQGFATLAELAALLHGAVAASRGAVDAGYAPYCMQVGQTGVTVQPKLYLAFGISGMVQHTVGMGGAETVVAVNSDPRAPIFDHADYGIVGDWFAAAMAMIRYLTKREGLA